MFKRFNKNDSPKGATAAAPSLVPSAKPAPSNAKTPSNPQPVPVKQTKKKVKPAPVQSAMPDAKETKRMDRLLEIRMDLHKRLLESLNLAALDKASEEDLRHEIALISREGLRDMDVVLNSADQKQLNIDLMDEVTGLGPLEVLLRDETVNDILVNGSQQVFVERAGILELTTVKFKDEKHLMRIIDKIVSAVGRRVDEAHLMWMRGLLMVLVSTRWFHPVRLTGHWYPFVNLPKKSFQLISSSILVHLPKRWLHICRPQFQHA